MARILVLDDDLTFLALLQDLLAEFGHEAVVTSHDDEALQILRSETVDLFAQDIQRPTGNGWELARKMRDDPKLRDIPILIITGAPDPPDQHALGLVDAYLAKPFGCDALKDIIDRTLAG